MANHPTSVRRQVLRCRLIAFIFTIAGPSLPVSTAALYQSAETLQPSDSDDVFTDIEPGVRTLGKPSPSAVLGQVLKFAVLPENRFILVCSDGVKLWNNETQKVIKTHPFAEPITDCVALKWSPNRQLLAISTWSHLAPASDQVGRVLIFDKTLKLNNELVVDDVLEPKEYVKNRVNAIEFSPDNRAIALSTANELSLIDIESEEEIQKFSMGITPARPSMLLFHENKVLALGSNSKSFDLETGKVSVLPAPLDSIPTFFFCDYDAATKRLFLSDRSGPKEIQLADGKVRSIDSLEESSRSLELSLSPDGSLLAISQLKTVGRHSSLWLNIVDTKDFNLKYQFKDLPGRPSQIRWDESLKTIYVSFNMSTGFQKLELDARVVQQTPNFQLNKPLTSVAVSFDGSHVVSTTSSTSVTSRDWTTGKPTQLNSCSRIFPTVTTDGFFAMNQKGQTLSLTKQQFKKKKTRTIQAYSMRQNVAVPLTAYLFGASDRPTTETYFVFPGSVSINELKTQVHCVVLDGLAGIRIQSFQLPNYKRTRDVLFKRPSKTFPNSHTAITNSGDRFAITEDGKLKIIKIATAETLFEIDAHKVDQLMFSRDGTWLAMTKPDGVTILETETGKQLKQIGVQSPLVAYAFSADELLVTSKTAGSPVRIFDTRQWRVKFEHAIKTNERVAVSISGNGKRIAFALSNCCVELWDVDEIVQ